MSETKSPITRVAGEAVAQKRLIKLKSTGPAVTHGRAMYCTATATDRPVGVSDYYAASGDVVAVRTLSEDGTLEITAAGAIPLAADVYPAADGKVQALPTDGGAYRRVGVAMEAATADGDIIEFLPSLSDDITYVAETVTASGTVSVVSGVATQLDSSGGAIAATLADGAVIGQKKFIVMTDASNSSTVSIAHHATSDPEVATFDAVDEFLELVWTGTEWDTVKATATFV